MSKPLSPKNSRDGFGGWKPDGLAMSVTKDAFLVTPFGCVEAPKYLVIAYDAAPKRKDGMTVDRRSWAGKEFYRLEAEAVAAASLKLERACKWRKP